MKHVRQNKYKRVEVVDFYTSLDSSEISDRDRLRDQQHPDPAREAIANITKEQNFMGKLTSFSRAEEINII